MRKTSAFVILAVVLAPLASGATQDEVLTEYASFGEDELFAEYPALLFLKLTISNRLQTGQVAGDELARFEDVLRLLKEMERLHGDLADAGRETILDGLADCAELRANVEALDDPATEQYQRILNLTAAGITRSYVLAAESMLPSIGRTAQRLALLEAAVQGANAIQDGLAYSRLSRLETETREDYDADTSSARDAVGHARDELAIAPRAFSLEFPRHYAGLFSTRDRLADAEGRFNEHGESENASEARALQDTVNARIRALGLLLAGVVVIYLAILAGIGALILERVVRWTQHRHRAGLGDELSMGLA